MSVGAKKRPAASPVKGQSGRRRREKPGCLRSSTGLASEFYVCLVATNLRLHPTIPQWVVRTKRPSPKWGDRAGDRLGSAALSTPTCIGRGVCLKPVMRRAIGIIVALDALMLTGFFGFALVDAITGDYEGGERDVAAFITLLAGVLAFLVWIAAVVLLRHKATK